MLTQRDARVIESLPDIKVPSLVVVGADDTPFLAASDYMAAKIPGAKKVVIPAAGHAVNIDQPQAFIDAVLPFLDGLPMRRLGKASAVMKRFACIAAFALVAISVSLVERTDASKLAAATPLSRPPFTATLSNTTPLAFGMNVEDVARALGQPLSYISGRPGDEIYWRSATSAAAGSFNHQDRLFLQFRKGRLAGWKGDWGHNWMWE